MFRQNLSIMFLGTASGGGPSESRNCSSLLCDFMNDLSLWLVDCAEGSLRQFQLQPKEGFRYRANKVNKIFITHMHADHIMGIVPFLRCILFPPEAGALPAYTANPNPPRVEIYGPAGLRSFVRQIMKMTLTFTADTYVVHELLTQDDPVTPCNLPEPSESGFDHNIANLDVMHVSEVGGNDFRADDQGFWRNFVSGQGRMCNISVDAGCIQHRDPCLGFVFRETAYPNRKVVILGDTYDPSQIIPLCLNPPPRLLIHEATDAPIPAAVDREGKLSKRAPEEVKKKALLRGHSVPAMAGTFAKTIKADYLVLNHIGSRFPAPRHPSEPRTTIMKEIERQATEAWASKEHSAVAAQDFLRVNIPISGPASFFNPPAQAQTNALVVNMANNGVPNHYHQQQSPTLSQNGHRGVPPQPSHLALHSQGNTGYPHRSSGRGGGRGYHHSRPYRDDDADFTVNTSSSTGYNDHARKRRR